MESVINEITYELLSFDEAVKNRLSSLEREHINERLWNRDATLWKDDRKSAEKISESLGWMDTPSRMTPVLPEIIELVRKVRSDGYSHVIVLGMGGNTLASLVFARTFGTGKNGLELSIIDTTDPAEIQRVEQKASLRETLFIVASKSGVEAETSALAEYFYNKLKAINGVNPGNHFVAITDRGTPLAEKARGLHYRQIFLNFEGIASHFSALSYFGMVPAALMGLDVEDLLGRAVRMQQICQTHNTPSENPAIRLGAIMGEMAIQNRNKLTIVLPDSLSTLGLWLEQLIAEGTGKEGKGILPITGELLEPSLYRDDRLFVYLHLQGEHQPEITGKLQQLTKAGHPLVSIAVESMSDIAGEFYRWEMAVAVAGSIIGVNVFDQPNVEESKERTNQILGKYEKEGALPVMDPAITEGKLTFFTYRNKFDNALALLDTFMNAEHVGDYLAIQAFLPEEPQTDLLLQKFRNVLQQRLKRATTLAYGPRFLHSTGQYHKGGPNTGLYIQLIGDDQVTIEVPGKNYSFGTFKRAQADGDFTLMEVHSRRIIRVDLNGDIHSGMAKLIDLVTPTELA